LEQRRVEVELHEWATTMISARTQPFLAPWWLSPAMAYWSGQPGVAGSSHESLPGIVDSARFFLAQDPAGARQILARHRVSLVVAYDADRVTANSAAILGAAAPAQTLARILDRTPAQAPSFLELTSQNGSAKLFQVTSQQ
jgi:hypothetical protein